MKEFFNGYYFRLLYKRKLESLLHLVSLHFSHKEGVKRWSGNALYYIVRTVIKNSYSALSRRRSWFCRDFFPHESRFNLSRKKKNSLIYLSLQATTLVLDLKHTTSHCRNGVDTVFGPLGCDALYSGIEVDRPEDDGSRLLWKDDTYTEYLGITWTNLMSKRIKSFL